MINKYLTKFSIVLGFIYIIFLFWFRIIHERLPKELNGHYDIIVFLFYLIFLLLSLGMFCFFLLKVFKKQSIQYNLVNKIYNIELIKNAIDYFLEYILNAPYNFYIWFYNNVDIIRPIAKIGSFIWNRDPHKNVYIIAITLCILKLIVSIFFITDIVVFHKFHYFYKSLVLLLIILMVNSFIFILKDTSEVNFKFIEENILTLEFDNESSMYIADFASNYEGEQNDSVLFHHYQYWVAFKANCMFADKFYEYYNIYNNYISAIYYGIFVIGWSYILITSF